MTRGLPSSPRTTLLTGAASLIAPTYLLRSKEDTAIKKESYTYVIPENYTLSGVITVQRHRSMSVPKLYSSVNRPPLIPDLLKDRWTIIDVTQLDDDSGAGLHSSHAQGMHHQQVRCCLLPIQRNVIQKYYFKLLCAYISNT